MKAQPASKFRFVSTTDPLLWVDLDKTQAGLSQCLLSHPWSPGRLHPTWNLHPSEAMAAVFLLSPPPNMAMFPPLRGLHAPPPKSRVPSHFKSTVVEMLEQDILISPELKNSLWLWGWALRMPQSSDTEQHRHQKFISLLNPDFASSDPHHTQHKKINHLCEWWDHNTPTSGPDQIWLRNEVFRSLIDAQTSLVLFRLVRKAISSNNPTHFNQSGAPSSLGATDPSLPLLHLSHSGRHHLTSWLHATAFRSPLRWPLFWSLPEGPDLAWDWIKCLSVNPPLDVEKMWTSEDEEKSDSPDNQLMQMAWNVLAGETATLPLLLQNSEEGNAIFRAKIENHLLKNELKNSGSMDHHRAL